MNSNIIRIISYDKAAVQHPFQTVTTTDPMCEWIGKFTITWSELERQLDELIEALGNAFNLPAKWIEMSFKRRKRLCKDAMKHTFPNCPTVRSHLADLLGEATELQWQRNFLVHGRIKTTLRVVTPGDFQRMIPPVIDAEISATGRHKGQITTITLMTGDVERLFYETGHLLGRFTTFIMPDGETTPSLASQEIREWREFLAANHPNLPTAEALSPPPQSSQE